MENLQGKRVAILVADGFEQVELTEPKKALDRGRREDGDRLSRQGEGEGLEPHGLGAGAPRGRAPRGGEAPKTTTPCSCRGA